VWSIYLYCYEQHSKVLCNAAWLPVVQLAWAWPSLQHALLARVLVMYVEYDVSVIFAFSLNSPVII